MRSTTPAQFPLALESRFRPIITPLGVTGNDGVTVTDDELIATYGWVSLRTPLENIRGGSISGPHRWYTAVGLRLSFSDDGLTFGTTPTRGVCIEFIERVPRVIGSRDHSALWVSVADCEGLLAALPGSSLSN